MPTKKVKYWLFQSSPQVFRLKEALAADAVTTFAVKAHKKAIRTGDKIILWQSGKKAGCYGLGTVLSAPTNQVVKEKEKSYFLNKIEEEQRINLRIEYNLWNRPITKEILPNSQNFDEFYAGIPGTNFKATKKQYEELVDIVEHLDMAHEPESTYVLKKPLLHSLNNILQGPPGTGKTYQTVNYALSIIENRTLRELVLEPRKDLRQRFEAYQEEGRIQFITFHQSYAYEDFVEGIKPFTQNGQIQYGIENGIFKQIAIDARRCLVEAMAELLPQYEIEVEFNQLYRAFLGHLKSDNFSTFATPNNRAILLQKVLRFGNLSVRKGTSFSTFTISKSKLKRLYQQITNLAETPYTAELVRSIIGDVDTNAYWGVFIEFKNFEQQLVAKEIEALAAEETVKEPIDLAEVSEQVLRHCRKYVLIIDEINRGNIPSIFGELISLIEPDKREGQQEAIHTLLPYSKEVFAVPPNLYLLGTMNTSDRSVEAMDMALRRRFNFIEMPPQPALLRPAIEAGVDLEKLLTTINQRIDILLDKDHLIGHAYLMNVHTLDDLMELFDKKIIPLLKEYFFGDLNKLGLVIGKGFFNKIQAADSRIFGDFEADFIEELAYKKVYELKPASDWKESDFIRIYDASYIP